ncbi:MAG TPA: hypothetical protein VHG28_06325 [Longimicrobiaceae bacterium]|nr:hypothetical protein [Longimicrobiaceae bacterium]
MTEPLGRLESRRIRVGELWFHTRLTEKPRRVLSVPELAGG